ncbi:MAG: nuclear transport factor 2 family protein [Limnohabitans sp.]|jgi:ketosteroid isomerase-like protein|nr:nuclear transport factor 2 family protein [Limnohabitans sp.]
MHDPALESSVDRLVQFFEQLTPQQVSQLSALYAPDVFFKDPFNEVRGLDAVTRIFNHMYEALDSPHFIVTERIAQGQQCFLGWDFRFRFKRFDTTTWQTVRGATHLRLNEQGLVILHRDYWDAAEELYEKLPVVGGLMRWLKRQANA